MENIQLSKQRASHSEENETKQSHKNMLKEINQVEETENCCTRL